MTKTLAFLITFAIMLTPVFAQVTGDYRSAVNGGNWGTAATWERYDGANWVTAASQPGTSNNVTIRNGFDIILDASGKNCANLTIDSGATFSAGLALPTSSIRYVRINGASAIINGTFGSMAGAGDAIAFESANVGGTVTITGSGTFAPSRVRFNSSVATASTIVFDIDTHFKYTGSTGTGGVALYPQVDNCTFTFNTGKTISFPDQGSLSLSSSVNAVVSQSCTINVFGTLDLSQPNTQLTLRSGTGKTAIMNISSTGSVVVGRQLNTSTVADGGTTVIVDDGAFTVNGNVDLSNPSTVITGTGTFTLPAGATLLIGHPEGISSSGATGQIQTATRSFNTGAIYSYVGTAAQTTGNGLPSPVNSIIINNASGVSLGTSVAVDSILTLATGNLDLNGNNVSLGTAGVLSEAGGRVFGSAGTISATRVLTSPSDAVNIAGLGVGIGSTADLGSTVITRGHAAQTAGGGGINRYFDISPTNNSGLNATMQFRYYDAELNGLADSSLQLFRSTDSGASWTFTGGTADTATNTISLSSIDAFSRWTAAKYSVPTPVGIMSNGTGGGDWAATTTWQGGVVPTAIDTVVILGTDSVFVLANTSCTSVTILSGGKLGLTGKLSLSDLTVHGKVTVHADTLNPSGTMSVQNGGVYVHAQNGGRLPTATWNTGSTCQIAGVVAAAPNNGNQNFYNVIWNCPAQTASVNMGWNGISIGGTVNVINTNTGRWQFCAPIAGDSAVVTIQGDVLLANGNLTTNGTSNGNTKIVINHFGNVNITGGNFAISRGSQGGTGTSTWYMRSGNFTMTNATSQNSNSAGGRFVFAKSGTQSITLTNITFAGGGLPVQVDSGATLDVGSSVLRGSGVFTLNSGATLACGNTGGIDSTLQNSGTKSLSKRAGFTFNASASQATGILLPDTINNLTINNAAGVSLSGGTVVNGVLTFTSGNLATGSDTLRISPTGNVSRTSGHVVGLLQKNVESGSNVMKTFEVGSGASYTPVNVRLASVTAVGELLVSTTGSDHPNIASSGIDPAHNVNRYWSLSNIGIGFTSYDAVFNFVAGDVDAGSNPSIFIGEKYDGATWSGLTEGTRTATSTEVIDVTSFSDFAVGQSVAAPPAIVLSNGTGGGSWELGSTWQGGIVPTAIDSVVIRGTDSVAVLGSASCSGLLVQSGTKLDLYAKLSLFNVVLDGKIVVNVDTLFPSGAMSVRNGGTYTHAQNGGRIPDATWEVGSTIELTGIVGNSPSNGNQNFYNVVWNSPNQSSNLNLGWNGNTIGGTIRVINSGLSRWQLCAPASGDSAFVTIQGDVLVEGGQFSTNGTSNANTKIVVNHFGNVNVAAGNFAISRGSQGGTGTSTWYMRNGNFTISNATTQNSNPAGGKFVFAKPGGTQSITLTNVTFAGGGLPVQIDGASAVDVGTSVFRGSGVFTLNAQGSLLCGNTGGLDSSLQNTGTKILSKDALYSFNATTAQRTGNLLPDTVRSLFAADSVGVTLSNNVTVNEFLEITKGTLDLNGKTIVLGPAATLSETAGNTVAGDSGVVMTTRTLNAPNAADDIAGLGVRIGSSANLGSTVISRGHAVQTVGGGSIGRYFDITPATNTGLNATFVFRYDDSELRGLTESSLRLFRSTDNGSSWSQMGGTVNAPANTVTLTGVNQFSRWTAGQGPTGIEQQSAPLEFSLKQNYPNPFNPTTTIKFSVEQTGPTTLEIYNILGQKLMTLFNDVAEAGEYHTVQFNAQALSSGIYMYRLQSGSRNEVRKLMLLK